MATGLARSKITLSHNSLHVFAVAAFVLAKLQTKLHNWDCQKALHTL